MARFRHEIGAMLPRHSIDTTLVPIVRDPPTELVKAAWDGKTGK